MTADCCLFAGFGPSLQNRVHILETKGVSKMPGTCGIPEPVVADRINSLQLALRSDFNCDRHSILATGAPIEVDRGSRKGLKGTVARVAPKLRIMVNITSVCQALAVEVSLDDIAAVEYSNLQPHEYPSSAWTIVMRLAQKNLAIDAFGS